MDIANFLRTANERFLRSLSDDNELRRFRDTLNEIVSGHSKIPAHHQSHQTRIEAQKFRCITSYFAQIAQYHQRLSEEVVCESDIALTCALKPEGPSFSTDQISNGASSSNSAVLRQWFLNNICNPFPSNACKQILVDQSQETARRKEAGATRRNEKQKPRPPAINYEQCQLWFINSRRRSGWTHFYREFAFCDKQRMHELVEALRSNDDQRLHSILSKGRNDCSLDKAEIEQLSDNCKRAWVGIHNWLNQVNADDVGDWMDDVIKEAKEEVKAAKALRKEEKRRIREVQERLRADRKRHRDESSESEEDAPPARRRRRVPSTKAIQGSRRAPTGQPRKLSSSSTDSNGESSLFSAGSSTMSSSVDTSFSFGWPEMTTSLNHQVFDPTLPSNNFLFVQDDAATSPASVLPLPYPAQVSLPLLDATIEQPNIGGVNEQV